MLSMQICGTPHSVNHLIDQGPLCAGMRHMQYSPKTEPASLLLPIAAIAHHTRWQDEWREIGQVAIPELHKAPSLPHPSPLGQVPRQAGAPLQIVDLVPIITLGVGMHYAPDVAVDCLFMLKDVLMKSCSGKVFIPRRCR